MNRSPQGRVASASGAALLPDALHSNLMPSAATSRPPRTHPVRFAAPDLGRDPATAHVAEDPLRAYPAPLGDVGLPPAFGPVRPPTFASCSVPRGNLPTPARLAAAGDIAKLMPSASLPSPSATPPSSAAPAKASPVTGFRTLPSCTVHSIVTASAQTSDSLIHTSAVGSVRTLDTPRFTPYGSGANDDDTDRPRADLIRTSVFNTLPCPSIPTPARLVASGDIARLTPSSSASWVRASHHHRCR